MSCTISGFLNFNVSHLNYEKFNLCLQNTLNTLKTTRLYFGMLQHIDVRYHFVREIIEGGGVLAQKIKTDDNPANILTKVVKTIKFNHCLDLINIAKV